MIIKPYDIQTESYTGLSRPVIITSCARMQAHTTRGRLRGTALIALGLQSTRTDTKVVVGTHDVHASVWNVSVAAPFGAAINVSCKPVYRAVPVGANLLVVRK